MRSPSIAEYDQAVERLIARIEAACETEPRWTARLLRGLEELLAYLAESPARARLLTGEVLHLPGGPDRHRASLDRLARLLRPARDFYPGAEALSEDIERVLVAGICAILATGLSDPTAERPLPLAADLAELALSPYAGAAQAHGAIEYELGRRRDGRKGLAGLRLAPEVTAADQRRRLFAATVEEVLDRGLGRASVLRIANQAEISKVTFYERFSNKRECFLAAYEDLDRRLRTLVFERAAEEAEWPDRVRAAVAGALRFFAAEPRALLLFAAEGDALDAWVAERNRAAMRAFAEGLAEGRRFASAELPDSTEADLLARALATARERVLDDEVASLPGLAPRLTALLLSPYLGAERARQVAAQVG